MTFIKVTYVGERMLMENMPFNPAKVTTIPNSQYDKFHEKEIFYLKAKTGASLKTLRRVLRNLHIAERDDSFILRRTGEFPNWQSISVLDIDVFNNEYKLNLEHDEPWNELKISYLFATLPFGYTVQFLDIIFELAHALDLSVEHNGHLYTKEDLMRKFNEYREDVLKVLDDEPGSEIVDRNIAMTYPRNK